MPMPRKFPDGTADQLEERVEEYFDSLWSERTLTTWRHGEKIKITEPYQRPPTMAGLALHLGTFRRTLIDYKERDEFAPVIARALERIAAWAEEALYTREGVTGARFSLEVNHRYGREDQQGGAGFSQTIIAPAPIDTSRAIPLWSDDDEPEA